MVVDFTRATAFTNDVGREVEGLFQHHPWSEDQKLKGDAVRHALTQAVGVIISNVPPGPDRTVAIRKIREAGWGCSSAITHDGKY